MKVNESAKFLKSHRQITLLFLIQGRHKIKVTQFKKPRIILFGSWGVTNHFVPASNTDYKQSTEAINMKPTPGLAPGTQLSGEVSYFFVRPSIGPPTCDNQRVSSLVFKVTPIIE